MKLLSLSILVILVSQNVFANDLKIAVNPMSPVIISEGSPLTLANGEKVYPPYFVVNNVQVSWSNPTMNAQLLALKFIATEGSNSQCAYSGQDIQNLFSQVTYKDSMGKLELTSLIDMNVNVTLPAAVDGNALTYTTAGYLYCGSLSVTNTSNSSIYQQYNVPMDVILDGESFSSNGVVSRLTATSRIVLQ